MLKLRYSHAEIKYYYEKIVSEAFRKYHNRELNRAIKTIEIAAKIQYNYNHLFADERLDKLLSSISEQKLSVHKKLQDSKKYLFYDAFGWENRGLTQQYIRAILKTECDILFIFENYSDKYGKQIFIELQNNPHVTIYKLDNTITKLQQIDILYTIISKFNPAKIFLHLAPWSATALVTICAFPMAIKYLINLTDHTFWLGSSLINYSLEFRRYGCSLSVSKRNILKNRLLLLPYYPIRKEEAFQGFPIDTTKKIVVFSGGSLYKTYSKDNYYFHLIKLLLDINPDIVFFYAGEGNTKPFVDFIIRNNYQNRIFLLGFREDINEIFKHTDIYLSTYPLAGGLMSQYAALNSIPILAYTKKTRAVESVICINKYIDISLTNEQDFVYEARKLVNDKNYRKEKGILFRNLMINEEQFNDEFNYILQNNSSLREISMVDIDYTTICNQYLYLINYREYHIEAFLLFAFRVKLFFYPKIIVNLCFYLLLKCKRIFCSIWRR
jgi:hypothetical protein